MTTQNKATHGNYFSKKLIDELCSRSPIVFRFLIGKNLLCLASFCFRADCITILKFLVNVYVGINFILFVIAPGRPPLYITYSSPSSTSLLVEWGAIPPRFKNGIIRGFQVHFQYNGTVEVRMREPRLYWVILDGLKKFTVYHIRVFAFTNEGYGPESNITAVTAQDGMERTYNIFFLLKIKILAAELNFLHFKPTFRPF